jgi:hypothetical protein
MHRRKNQVRAYANAEANAEANAYANANANAYANAEANAYANAAADAALDQWLPRCACAKQSQSTDSKIGPSKKRPCPLGR